MGESLTDQLADWDLVACVPSCRRPWRRRRWRAPRVWTCPGCRTLWTVEGRAWVQALSPAQLTRLEQELGLAGGSEGGGRVIGFVVPIEPDPIPLPRREDYPSHGAYVLAFHIARAQRQDGLLNREESAAQFAVIEQHVRAWSERRMGSDLR